MGLINMEESYFEFKNKDEFISALNGDEFNSKSSVVYPDVFLKTGVIITTDDGEEYEEQKIKEGFFVNVLGDYPKNIEPYKIEVESPSINWA